MLLEIVLAVLGVLVPVVMIGGGWLLRRWGDICGDISDRLDDISTKLDKPETAPTRGDISTKLDDISGKFDKPETAPTRGDISTKLDDISGKLDKHETPTLRAHGEMLADLQKGQTDMIAKLKDISAKLAKLECFRPQS